MGCYKGGTAVCPFYVKESEKSITCEGLIPGTNMMIRFGGQKKKTAWLEKHCCSYKYEVTCPVAAVLMWKYTEE